MQRFHRFLLLSCIGGIVEEDLVGIGRKQRVKSLQLALVFARADAGDVDAKGALFFFPPHACVFYGSDGFFKIVRAMDGFVRFARPRIDGKFDAVKPCAKECVKTRRRCKRAVRRQEDVVVPFFPGEGDELGKLWVEHRLAVHVEADALVLSEKGSALGDDAPCKRIVHRLLFAAAHLVGAKDASVVAGARDFKLQEDAVLPPPPRAQRSASGVWSFFS